MNTAIAAANLRLGITRCLPAGGGVGFSDFALFATGYGFGECGGFGAASGFDALCTGDAGCVASLADGLLAR
jgi:hypothetical protein